MATWEQGDVNGDLRFNSSDLVIAFVDGGFEKGPRLVGDYNRSGLLDAGDLDLQATEIVRGEHPEAYDLNDDGLVDFDDRQVWVNDLKNTWMGDANLDLEWNSSDLVQAFAAGKYKTGQTAGWEEGDWNGDMRFNVGDLIGTRLDFLYYEAGRKRDVVAVPEPSAVTLLAIGMLGLMGVQRRS